MIRIKFFGAILILMLLFQTTVLTASAEAAQPAKPSLAFLDPTENVSLYLEDLTNGWPVYIVNSSPDPVNLQVQIVGMDILQADITAKTLDPGEVIGINFTLVIDRIIKGKTYNGFVVFKDPAGNTIDKALTIHPGPKPQALSIDTALPTWIDRIADGIQVWWQQVIKQQVRFGPPEWSILAILVALVLFGLLWLVRGIQYLWWNARGKLGPVFIEEIKEDSTDKPALTASLRHHLSHCGMLPRVATPNTSIGLTEFNDIVSKSKLPEAAFLQAILVFLQKVLGRNPGYIVTTLVTEADSKTTINIQIKLAQSGQMQYIETMEESSTEEAIKEAAHYIFYRISSRKTALARIPEWLRFPTFASFHQYKCAEELKWSGNYASAIELYKSASEDAPFNALLLQGWGDACELNEQFTQAIEVYLKAVSMWPHLFSFWYRLAVDFSYADKWLDDAGEKASDILTVFNSNHPPEKWFGRNKIQAGWLNLWGLLGPILVVLGLIFGNGIWKFPGIPGAILGDILGGLLGVIIGIVVDIIGIGILNMRSASRDKGISTVAPGPSATSVATRMDFPREAKEVYDFLKRELDLWEAISNWRFWRGVSRWYSIFKPVEYTPRLTNYFWHYISIPHIGRGNGAQLKRIAEIARASVEVTHPEGSQPDTGTANSSDASKTEHNGSTPPDIEKLKSDIDRIVNNHWGNRSDVYYDAACFYARLSAYYEQLLNNPTEKVWAMEKALEYLKKADKDQAPLEVEWTRTDPDLESLHENTEFRALFDVPTRQEKEDQDIEEVKNKCNTIVLLLKGAGLQSDEWRKHPIQAVSLIGLITEADYQVRLWTSLEALSEKPADRELLESFWKLVSQKKDPAEIMPAPDESEDIKKYDTKNKANLGSLKECVKFINTSSKSQLEIWKERQADCKLDLENTHTPMADVWDRWSQAEIGQWQYLQGKIQKTWKKEPKKAD
jgi:tetratricopeptide (TPR) repeat protein